MAGPGGGSRGGGFGGGGSRGGGFGGGGRRSGGGGFRPRRPYYGGFHHHHHYHRGGLLSGLLGIIMLPIVVIFISILFLAVYAYSTIGVVLNGGEVVYDEAKFQSYAVGEYYDYYNDTATKEDNIMLVFLTMEGYEKYFCIAITGDNLKTNVVSLFGNDTTPFGKAVLGSIGKNYQYSLDKNMAEAVEKMTANVGNLSLSSPYIKENDRSGALAPKLINHTELELTDETVNTALEEFATETGISMSIVVDTAENVFGKSIPWGGLVLIVAVVALIIFCIYYIVKKAKERKRIDEDLGGTGPIDPPIL